MILSHTLTHTHAHTHTHTHTSDAVPLLIDADARTLKQTKAIIEAAKNGQSTNTFTKVFCIPTSLFLTK